MSMHPRVSGGGRAQRRNVEAQPEPVPGVDRGDDQRHRHNLRSARASSEVGRPADRSSKKLSVVTSRIAVGHLLPLIR